MTLFNELNISSEVMKAVEEMGYENAIPGGRMEEHEGPLKKLK